MLEYSEYPVRCSLVELDVSNNRITVVEAERLLLLPQAPHARVLGVPCGYSKYLM